MLSNIVVNYRYNSKYYYKKKILVILQLQFSQGYALPFYITLFTIKNFLGNNNNNNRRKNSKIQEEILLKIENITR